MLINRVLREHGYIFSNNIDIPYLKLLIDLGSYPIITSIRKDNVRYFRVIETADLKYLANYIFNYERCSIADIKEILYTLKCSKDINALLRFPYILQLHLNKK